MGKVLPSSFFNRTAPIVAKELLGKYLVRRLADGREIAVSILETEAYDGPKDLASHARHGRTPRASIMFGDPGYFYVFFTYGMHWMTNIVTGPKNYPSAVLFRGALRESSEPEKSMIVNGPARLAKFLSITGADNGAKAGKKAGIWIEDRGVSIPAGWVARSKRIGVDYAGPIWGEKKWNFKIKDAAALLQKNMKNKKT